MYRQWWGGAVATDGVSYYAKMRIRTGFHEKKVSDLDGQTTIFDFFTARFDFVVSEGSCHAVSTLRFVEKIPLHVRQSG
jgi:hypothetical protein